MQAPALQEDSPEVEQRRVSRLAHSALYRTPPALDGGSCPAGNPLGGCQFSRTFPTLSRGTWRPSRTGPMCLVPMCRPAGQYIICRFDLVIIWCAYERENTGDIGMFALRSNVDVK